MSLVLEVVALGGVTIGIFMVGLFDKLACAVTTWVCVLLATKTWQQVLRQGNFALAESLGISRRMLDMGLVLLFDNDWLVFDSLWPLVGARVFDEQLVFEVVVQRVRVAVLLEARLAEIEAYAIMNAR